ncbi:MAG: RnfH family protein [Burkholderiaceae bacterium]|nr:RnfH family protein [Rhodoferax sp.]MCB2027612.1 RnfH family protein [Rhodoferax sp.]MCP5260338.1 RnfH family protein [Rhodoferax sp.]
MSIRVTLVFSPGPRMVHEEALDLPPGSTVRQALQGAAALLDRHGFAPGPGLAFGIWGRKVDAGRRLEDGDRLELYRPLRVDPKVARRARFEAQGAGPAGLFARRRPGAKAGY